MSYEFVRELPKGRTCTYTPGRQGKVEGYFVVQMLGDSYYIPLTSKIKRQMGIKRNGDKIEFLGDIDGFVLEGWLRAVIGVVYCQVRDVVVSEAAASVTEEVKDRIDELLRPRVREELQSRVEKKETSLIPAGRRDDGLDS